MEKIGISPSATAIRLKSGKVKGVRFSTLEAICEYLDCQPGDRPETCSNISRRSRRKN